MIKTVLNNLETFVFFFSINILTFPKEIKISFHVHKKAKKTNANFSVYLRRNNFLSQHLNSYYSYVSISNALIKKQKWVFPKVTRDEYLRIAWRHTIYAWKRSRPKNTKVRYFPPDLEIIGLKSEWQMFYRYSAVRIYLH